MKYTSKMKSMQAYELLENQMTFLAAIFGGLAILCTLLAFHYNKQKSQAATREMSWIDEHKNEGAIRFQFYDGSIDLGFLYATLHIFKKTENDLQELKSITILAKESEIYLKPGSYEITVETREFQNKIINVNILDENIQQRQWFSAPLIRK